MKFNQLYEATLVTATPPLFPKSSDAIKDILPQPATVNRKAQYSPSIPFEPLYNIKELYIKSNELYKEFSISFGSVGVSKEVTNGQMEMWAKKYLESIHNKEEARYIDVVEATTKKVLYRFNVNRWLNDNFADTKSKYDAPVSVLFEFKVAIPAFFKDNSNIINGFICQRFLDYMSSRKSKLKNSGFSFLKDVEANMFEPTIDNRLGYKGGIRCKLKQSIVLGALAIYSANILHQHLTPAQIASINKTASRFTDTGDLNRFLRKMK